MELVWSMRKRQTLNAACRAALTNPVRPPAAFPFPRATMSQLLQAARVSGITSALMDQRPDWKVLQRQQEAGRFAKDSSGGNGAAMMAPLRPPVFTSRFALTIHLNAKIIARGVSAHCFGDFGGPAGQVPQTARSDRDCRRGLTVRGHAHGAPAEPHHDGVPRVSHHRGVNARRPCVVPDGHPIIVQELFRALPGNAAAACDGASATPEPASCFSSMNTARSSGGSVVPSSMCVVPFRVVESVPTGVAV